MDQAASYFGTMIEVELDQIGVTQTAKEQGIERARKERLDALLGLNGENNPQGSKFADPASLFTH